MAVDWSEAVVTEGEINMQRPEIRAMLKAIEQRLAAAVNGKDVDRLDAVCALAVWFGAVCAAQGLVFPQSRPQIVDLLQSGYDNQRRQMVLEEGGGNA